MTYYSSNIRYHLPKKGMKYTCPHCGGKKCFKRYIDEETGKELADDCGICDHKNRCGFHYPPRLFFHDHPEAANYTEFEHPVFGGRIAIFSTKASTYTPPPEFVQTEFYDIRWAESSRTNTSAFRHWVESLPYDAELIKEVLAEYYVGATKEDQYIRGINYGPAAVFWMIDEKMQVHDGKMIAYHSNGHRVDGWGNSVRSFCEKRKIGPQLEQTEKVLFGLHLLSRYPDKTVGIVESEKSAIICACHFPNVLWMATGGCGGLNKAKLKPLMNRRLLVFPDSGEYDYWCKRMEESEHTNYHVLPIIEDYEPNTDIADVLLGQAKLKQQE